jgi:hypothetical protein
MVFSQPDQLLLANLQKGAKSFEGLQFIYTCNEKCRSYFWFYSIAVVDKIYLPEYSVLDGLLIHTMELSECSNWDCSSLLHT